MRRKLFNLASALWLLLLAATIVGMARSSWLCADWITCQSSNVKGDQFFFRQLSIESAEGGVELRARTFHQTTHDASEAADYQRGLHPEDGIHWTVLEGNFGTSGWGTFSYDWYSGVSGHEATRQLLVHFPEWALALACLILPVVAVVRRARKRRTAGTGCPVCGYDLRATPDRCPECGHIPERLAS